MFIRYANHTQQNCNVFPKNLKTWRDSNPILFTAPRHQGVKSNLNLDPEGSFLERACRICLGANIMKKA
jgi:hypothetical protein